MKFAREVTLALGGISLVFAGLAVFMFYVDWMSRPATQVIEQPKEMVSIVNSAQDISQLKQVCNLLAVSRDTDIEIMRRQAALVDNTLVRLGIFVIGWGLVSGVAFLYVHVLLRRIDKN